MSIIHLEQILDVVLTRSKKRLAAAYANDMHTTEALYSAVKRGVITATLVGDEQIIQDNCTKLGIDADCFTIIHEPVDVKAAAIAVMLVRAGECQLLMKGLVSTDKYMRAILNKEVGLLDPGSILSHVAIIENPRYHKLIICSDVAVIPNPEIREKVAITNYCVKVAKTLGIAIPKVAIIGASEQVLIKMQAGVDAAILSKMADRGQIKGCLVDGPMGLDAAIDKEAANTKNVSGPVAGDADCLIFPNIEAGNIFYKTNTKLAGCEVAAVVMGTKAPCILSSRGDSAQTKLYSIALGALLAD
jgi:phosphate butyryltransferase